MTRNVQIVFQLIALFLQTVAPAIPGVPTEWRQVFAASVGFFQLAIAVIGQGKNPDGTPAAVAYEPQPKKIAQ